MAGEPDFYDGLRRFTEAGGRLHESVKNLKVVMAEIDRKQSIAHLESENAALRARIAELEAPVLPGEVRQAVERLRLAAECLEFEDCKWPASYCTDAAALLTRLSTVTEEDVERAATAMYRHEAWSSFWSGEDAKALARAALTTFLKETGHD